VILLCWGFYHTHLSFHQSGTKGLLLWRESVVPSCLLFPTPTCCWAFSMPFLSYNKMALPARGIKAIFCFCFSKIGVVLFLTSKSIWGKKTWFGVEIFLKRHYLRSSDLLKFSDYSFTVCDTGVWLTSIILQKKRWNLNCEHTSQHHIKNT